MGITARNPEEQTRQQGAGELVGEPPAHATGTVHLESVGGDGEVVRHRQRFEQGRLVAWELVDEAAPWALVRPGPPERPCPYGLATPEEVEAVSVRLGERVGPIPPLDDLAYPGWDALPRVPDATARLRYELTGSPVGRILVDIRYQDGKRPMSEVVGEWPEQTTVGEPAHDAPEMRVTMTFRNYLRMRAGELGALEAIAEGGDVGDTRWTLLLLLHGLLQEDAYVAAYRSLPVLPPELGWWGEAAPFVPSDARPS
jgi:hypothetical protein